LHDVRARKGSYALPNKLPTTFGLEVSAPECYVLYPLGIQINFTSVLPGKPLNKLRNGAFRPVPPVDERGRYGDPQVKSSIAGELLPE
jgi:hypothetical protein